MPAIGAGKRSILRFWLLDSLAMSARRAFRPALWPSLFALLGMAILLGLGSWQLERLRWKTALIASRTAQLALPPLALPTTSPDWAGLDYRQVELTGRWRPDLSFRFGTRAQAGQVGQALVTPLERAEGPAVLVERGWVPDAGPEPAAPEGPVTVAGLARYRGADPPSWFAPANQPAARRWYRYDLPALEAALGLKLAPVVVAQAPAPGALPPVPELPNNHLQYALTWYGLAAALLAVYVVFSCRPREADERRAPSRGTS